MKQKQMSIGMDVLFRMSGDPMRLLRIGKITEVPLQAGGLVWLESVDYDGKKFVTAVHPTAIQPMPANPRYFMVRPDTLLEDLLDAASWVRYTEDYRIAVTSAANWRVLEPLLRRRNRLMVGGILHFKDVVPTAWLEGILQPPTHESGAEPPEAERVY